MADPQKENTATEKTTLNDNDTFWINDSQDLSGGIKKTKVIKAANLTSSQANVISRIYAYNNLV